MNFILDADIRSFFNEVSQDWLVRFVKHQIDDPRIIRLIQKWLRAGVLEDGIVTIEEKGTGQGLVISPLLANVYLHYVFDLWAERWRRREATGDVIMVRYADDLVVGFEHESDARCFWDAMRRQVAGVRAVASSGQDPPDRVRPLCGVESKKAWARQTGDLQVPGVRSHLRKIPTGRLPDQEEVSARPHARKAPGDQGSAATTNKQALPGTGKWLAQVVAGFFAYHAVPTNGRALVAFRYHVKVLWRRQLRRRSQRGRVHGRRLRSWQMSVFRNRTYFTPGRACGSPLDTQGRSRVPELGSLGSVRGALSNERPYRE